MPKIIASVILLLSLFSQSFPQQGGSLSNEVRQFVTIDAPLIALTHARVIDGTGARARENQTVIISNGKVQTVGPSASTLAPSGAKVIDLNGKTVMPGLVMLHEHLFFPAGRLVLFSELGWSFPRLYLAAGVTSLRTAGSVEPYTDLNIKKLIDTGRARP